MSELAAEPLPAKQFEDLIDSIIPNNSMRQTHAFPAVSFREFVHHKPPRKSVFKNDDDTSTLKLFLVGKFVTANRVRPSKEKQSALPIRKKANMLLFDEISIDSSSPSIFDFAADIEYSEGEELFDIVEWTTSVAEITAKMRMTGQAMNIWSCMMHNIT